MITQACLQGFHKTTAAHQKVPHLVNRQYQTLGSGKLVRIDRVASVIRLLATCWETDRSPLAPEAIPITAQFKDRERSEKSAAGLFPASSPRVRLRKWPGIARCCPFAAR